MHIIYAVTTCSDRVYRQLFADAPRKPAFQSQKYHRLLIEGTCRRGKGGRGGEPAGEPGGSEKSPSSVCPGRPRAARATAIFPPSGIPIVKAVFVGVGTFFRTARLAGKDSAVVVDCLNRTTALAGLLAAKLRGRRCVGIVTDLPDMLGGSAFSKKLSNFVIRHCTDYVLLTQAMNDYLNPEGKPHVILEGHSDIAMERQKPSLARKASPRVCMYAGGVSKQYGLENLVKGFQKADLPDARLEIYGPGDYVRGAFPNRRGGFPDFLRRNAAERGNCGAGDGGDAAGQPPADGGGIREILLPLQDHGIHVHGNPGADHGSAGNAEGISPLRVPVGGRNR